MRWKLSTAMVLAVGVVACDATAGWGQFRAGFLPPPGRVAAVRAGGWGGVVVGRRAVISGFVGGWGYRYRGWNFWSAPLLVDGCGLWGWRATTVRGATWFGAPVVWGGWWYPPITTWTPLGWVPGFLPPGWGVGPGWNAGPWGWWLLAGDFFWNGDGLGPVPPIPLLARDLQWPPRDRPRPDPPRQALAREQAVLRPPPPEPPGDFLVISPRTPGATTSSVASSPVAASRPAQPVGNFVIVQPHLQKEPFRLAEPRGEVEIAQAVPFPVAAAPLFRVDPFVPPPRLNREPVDADPKKQAQRLVQRGREAFAAGEYGRAVTLFAAAADKDPTLPMPLFLQAQAELAAGRFADAGQHLLLGWQRHPQAAAHFDPREPYGSQPQRYAEHLAALRRVVAEHPREPLPAYLLGWQLWWSGDKHEARRWWERAHELGGPGGDLLISLR